MSSRMLPALMKYWRDRRGLSQLELSLESGVSSRHVSFIESGRAKPGEEVVLRLLSALRVPLRAQNEVLTVAGFAARFPEPAPDALPAQVEDAITRMLERHEPWPMTVLTVDGQVLRANRGAKALFTAFVAQPERLSGPLNLYELLFDPALLRPHIVDWHTFAQGLIVRLHREVLATGDARIETILERLLSYPGVPRGWTRPDFSFTPEPTLTLRLQRGENKLGFLIAATVFLAPQQVTLEELRLESCFPLDDQTREVCEQLSQQVQSTSPLVEMRTQRS